MNVPREPGGVNLNTIIMVGGFALSMGTSLLGLGVVWGQTQAEIEANKQATEQRLEAKQESINRLNVDMAAVQAAATAREARIRALELGQGRTEERLIAIQATLAEIKQQLEKVE